MADILLSKEVERINKLIQKMGNMLKQINQYEGLWKYQPKNPDGTLDGKPVIIKDFLRGELRAAREMAEFLNVKIGNGDSADYNKQLTVIKNLENTINNVNSVINRTTALESGKANVALDNINVGANNAGKYLRVTNTGGLETVDAPSGGGGGSFDYDKYKLLEWEETFTSNNGGNGFEPFTNIIFNSTLHTNNDDNIFLKIKAKNAFNGIYLNLKNRDTPIYFQNLDYDVKTYMMVAFNSTPEATILLFSKRIEEIKIYARKKLT